MIKRDFDFNLSGVRSKLCMKYDMGTSRTEAVLCLVQHRKTSNRKGPPDCCNGFDTSYLPFAKGHVVALELGGSDDQFNVVPQFEDWQGKPNGVWRQMEIALSASKYAGHIMLVTVGYGRGGAEESHEDAYDAFVADRIRDWTDPRIPDAFHIHVWAGSASVLDAITDDAKFDTAVKTLTVKTPVFTQSFILGNGMPQPDRGMYINQNALKVTSALHNSLARSDSLPSFLLEQGTMVQVRNGVLAMPGVVPTEAMGLQAFPIMSAYQTGMSGPKVVKKIKKRKADGLPTADDDDIGIPPAKKFKDK